jgi:hypothetical protein
MARKKLDVEWNSALCKADYAAFHRKRYTCPHCGEYNDPNDPDSGEGAFYMVARDIWCAITPPPHVGSVCLPCLLEHSPRVLRTTEFGRHGKQGDVLAHVCDSSGKEVTTLEIWFPTKRGRIIRVAVVDHVDIDDFRDAVLRSRTFRALESYRSANGWDIKFVEPSGE